MIPQDIGPSPQSFDLEQATRENRRYRNVVWSGRHLQLTLMSIPAGSDIGLEMHPDTDQFLRIDAGRGRAQIGASRETLDFDGEVSDGWCVLIPAGTWHNVSNIGSEPMQIYALYAPAHHKPGKIHETAADAMADMDDEPAAWSVQSTNDGATSDNFIAEASRQKAKALSRWEGEGGALGPPTMALDDADLRVLARLGAGLLLHLEDVSDTERHAIIAMAATLHAERDAERIKHRMALFLDEQKQS